MKFRFRFRHCILLLFLLLSCQRSAKLIREKFLSLKDKDEIVAVVFGDSISGGRGFSETGSSYGSFLKPMMTDYFGKKISVLHSCKAGDTYKTGIRRIEEDIVSFRPDVVFIMLGLTDSITRGLFLQVFKEQVNDFLKNMQDYEAFVIILTTTGFQEIDYMEDYRYKRLKEFNDIIKYSAAYHHFPVIDVSLCMENLWKKEPEVYKSMFTDLIHLNETGQKYVADYIMKTISDALEKPN